VGVYVCLCFYLSVLRFKVFITLICIMFTSATVCLWDTLPTVLLLIILPSSTTLLPAQHYKMSVNVKAWRNGLSLYIIYNILHRFITFEDFSDVLARAMGKHWLFCPPEELRAVTLKLAQVGDDMMCCDTLCTHGCCRCCSCSWLYYCC
jgi:hypothetical protein